jgi:hypothetical protein
LVIVNWASKQQYVVVVSRHLIVGLRQGQVSIFKPR